MEVKQENIGKKIIFLYPPELVKKELMDKLSDNEFEVYSLRDQKKVKQIAATYGESIFFLNIDTGPSEALSDQFLQKIKLDITDLQIGLLSSNISSPEQIKHYILDCGVNCGFIQLKQGTKAAQDKMIKILEVNHAKGKRKYVRYTCKDSDLVSLNLKIGENIVKGSIQDISSVGVCCQFQSSKIILIKNQKVPDIQLRLRGTLVHTSGVVLGQRKMSDGSIKYVIVFTTDNLDKSKEKIRSFIHYSLQKNFEDEFQLN